ncbi:hypothetical protein [Mycoplasmoides pirum]|nr:hypothetical protein [Mycoplasmoides pirum]
MSVKKEKLSKQELIKQITTATNKCNCSGCKIAIHLIKDNFKMDVKKSKRTLDDLFDVVVEIKDDIKRLDTRIDNLENRFDNLENRFDKLVKVNKLNE